MALQVANAVLPPLATLVGPGNLLFFHLLARFAKTQVGRCCGRGLASWWGWAARQGPPGGLHAVLVCEFSA